MVWLFWHHPVKTLIATIAVLGIAGIVHHPQVLAALDPVHAIRLLVTHGFFGMPAVLDIAKTAIADAGIALRAVIGG